MGQLAFGFTSKKTLEVGGQAEGGRIFLKFKNGGGKGVCKKN